MTLLKARAWLDFLHRGGNVAHFWCATPAPTSTWYDHNKPGDRARAAREAKAVNPEQYVSINPSVRVPPSNKAGNTDPKRIAKQLEYIQCINVLHCEFDGKDFVTEEEAAPYLPEDYDTLSPKAQATAMKAAQAQAFYADPAAYKAMALAAIRDLPYPPTLIVDSGGGYHCVPLYTEILTAGGWKKWDEVLPGEQVVGYDAKTETLTWTAMTGKIVKENDTLVRVHNNNFSAICTPEHNWVTHVKTGRQGKNLLKNQLTKAQDISRRRHKIVISAPFVTASDCLPISEQEAAVLGWVISDGRILPYDNAQITQSEKKYASTIRHLLQGIPHTENNYDKGAPDFVTWHIKSGWMRDLLQRSGLTYKSFHKDSWNQFVLKLSPSCRKAFLHAAYQGDGTMNKGAWCMVQKQGDKADALNLAIFLEGNAPRISGECASRPESQTRVTRAGHGFASWNIQVDDAGEGAVWCPQTELGTWVMRQGDTICITGNCYWYLQDTVYLTDDNRQQVIDTQHSWIAMNGGDPASSDITRVYRVIGSKNMKPGWMGDYPTVTAIEYDPDRLYDYAVLADVAADWKEAHTQAVTYRYEPAPIYSNGDKSGSVRTLFNEQHRIADLLQANGYTFKYRTPTLTRFARPGEKPASVSIFPADSKRPETSRHHSSNDPLHRDKGRDAYSIMQTLSYGDDWKAAYIHAKQAVGLWEETPVKTGDKVGDKVGDKTGEPATGNYFLDESADDEGNAQCVYRLYAGRFLYTNAYGWMQNVETHWETTNADAALQRAVIDTLRQRRKAAVDVDKESIIKIAKPDARKVQAAIYNYRSLVVATSSDFDSIPYLLNCQNGVVDLRTATLHKREEIDARFTYCLPIAYDPTADATEWLAFLRQVVPGEGMTEYLQRCVGYSITGDTREECFFYVYGPTRSGKGTFVNTVIKTLGYPSSPLVRGVSFNTFTVKREGDNQNFDLAPLKACRLVSASESKKNERFDDAKVKMITGNDPVTASHKHKDSFTYIPQYKIWLQSNNAINGDVDDDAFWYRVRVIEFPKSFAGHEDTTLKERMSSPANLRAVLAWAVEGARQWYAAGKLSTPNTVSNSTQKQRDSLDYVAQWLDECCMENEGIWTATSALYSSYERWCNQNGVSAKQQRGLTEALQHKGFGYDRKKADGKTIRVITGVSLL